MQPTAASERIILLDVLRGVAIFGMFTVNMTADLPWGSTFRDQSLDLADGTVMFLIDLLTNGKFITIFSFLFGIGFFLQLQRAQRRRGSFIAVYLRRLVGLFSIATLAIVAGLNTHILIDYSIFGVLLIFFARRSARFLLVAAVVCFVIEMSSSNFQTLSDLFVFEQMHRVEIIGDTSSEETIIKTNRDRIYSEGSFSEIASYRATGLADYLLSWKQRLSDASLLGLMLLGCYVCRRGALEERAVRVKMARIALPWLLGVGAVGMAIFTWVQPWPNADTQLLTLIGNIAFWPAGAPIFGLGYVAIITLVMENDVFRSVLSPFASVGRMALTNYLLHAFIIAVFTFQWGLGLYGAMGPFWGLMAVFVIFPFMMVASSWWIRHFLFGPAEWLWRTLTYGQLQSFRRVPETGVQSGGLR